MKNKLYSIVIPTFNRPHILKKTLTALNSQSFKNFEVIVVSDGFNDATKKIIESLKTKLNFPLNFIQQKHAGPASARNNGIKKASGKYILFIGDDMIPDKDCIKEHQRIRSLNEEEIILGFVDWHPDIKVTPFMKYLSPNGPQFNFKDIINKNDVSFKFFYTSNISIPRKILLEDSFDESFKFAAIEDLELGYRLQKRGIKLIHNPEAIVYHYHEISLKEFLERNTKTIIGFRILFDKHPELKNILIPRYLKLRIMLFNFISNWCYCLGIKNSKIYFQSLINYDILTKIEKYLLTY